jgi:TolA-binding protein
MRKTRAYILWLAVAAVLLSACSAKKNTAGSRFWQAFNTRYNVYYNGMTNYNEQIKLLENNYQDDYSQRLFIHPAEAYQHPKSPQPSGSFDRTIQKMEKAISLHSIKKKPKKKAGKQNDPKYKEWMKRDEYNPFLHNAWYMLAKAEYMKGDFLSSSATFHYIARHFTWKPELQLECNLWEALSYCAMGWTTEADNVLAHVHIDKIDDKRLLALANLAFADYYIQDKKYAQAIPHLSAALHGQHGGQKVRLNFLLGQLYEETGQNQLAYQAYKRAGSSMASTYRTKFNARIKQSAVFQGKDIKSEVKSLKAMTRYDRNKEYLDQIYYAIGNLYLSRGDTARAVENYVTAAKKSTRNGIDKAISQLRLGGIYFAQRKYDLAQPCYSEAVSQINEEYPNYKEIKKRSDVLDELSVYSGNVTLQDSLLKLSKLPLADQKKVIKKIIDELKKKEKEEAENAKREEYLAQQNAAGRTSTNKGASAAPTQYTLNTDKSWYFYNTAAKNQGKTTFQQQWGNRKLEDNWRRRNKNTFSLEGDNEENTAASVDTTQGGAPGDTAKVDKEKLKREEDPHYEEYYLKQIPSTPEQVATANDVIQEGLYNMGLILKDKLEDYDASAYEFKQLLDRYPDNTYRLDVYYNLYLLYMRQNMTAQAETYRQLILSDFKDSKYGMALEDPNYIDNLKNMGKVQEQMYAEAYRNYLSNNNAAVHEAYAEMMRKYPLSKLMPKFMFIDALAYVTQRNSEKFKSTLKELLERYPETDITPTASGMLKELNAGRKLAGAGGGNMRGMDWSSFKLGNDSTGKAGEKAAFKPLTETRGKAQLFVLAFDNDSVSSNQLLYEVARHNFKTYKIKDYDLEPMTFGSMGLLVVKGFANYQELLQYRSTLEGDKGLQLPREVHQVLISEDNFNLLVNEGRTFADYFQYLEEQNDKKQADRIPATAVDDDSIATAAAAAGKPALEPAQPVKSVRPAKVAPAKPEKLSKKEAARRAKAEKARQEAERKARIERERLEQKHRADSIAKSKLPTVIPDNPDLVIDDGTVPDSVIEEQYHYPHREIETQQPHIEGVDTAVVDTAVDMQQPATTTRPEAESALGKKAAEPQDDTRRLLKQKSDEVKQQEREQKAAEKAEKERQRQAEREAKAREKTAKAEQKAREEAEKNARKQKEEALKQAQKQKEEARKQKEQERKAQIKAKQEAQKQKARERKERQKQREAERKAYQKKKQEEAKARKKAAEERRKARER